MLIVSRRIDESIVIGDDITVTIREITGRTVRIGIDAPDDVSVHREEVYMRIMQGQQRVEPDVTSSAPRVSYRKSRAL